MPTPFVPIPFGSFGGKELWIQGVQLEQSRTLERAKSPRTQGSPQIARPGEPLPRECGLFSLQVQHFQGHFEVNKHWLWLKCSILM